MKKYFNEKNELEELKKELKEIKQRIKELIGGDKTT
jgi:cell shape-determining protein MreC